MTEQNNARGWVFQIRAADGVTWLDIMGKQKFSLKPSEGEEVAKMTTFEDEGKGRSQPMERSSSLTLEGRFLLSEANVRDPGQARVDVLGGLVGTAAMGAFRFRHSSQTLWTVWLSCWVSLGEIGGENNDKTSWGATFNRDGGATTMAV